MAEKKHSKPYIPYKRKVVIETHPGTNIPLDCLINTALEEAILGAIMIEQDTYSRVSEQLKVEMFYKEVHRKIFTAIVRLALAKKTIDMHTVTEYLREWGCLDEIGGPEYITLLTAKVCSINHLEYHIRIIRQKYLARELLRFSQIIQGKISDSHTDIFEFIEQTEDAIHRLAYQARTMTDNRRKMSF